MKKILILFILVLCSQLPLSAQASHKSTPVPSATPASTLLPAAPAVDERTLKISDNPKDNTPGVSTTGDFTFWDFLRMILILAAVIGLVVGFIYFLKKISGQGNTAESPIKILTTQALGGNRTLQVVEVGNDVLLLGTADNGVTLIKQITDQETIDSLRLASSAAKTAQMKKNFSSLLATVMGKKEKNTPDLDQSADKSTDFLKKQRDRLKNMQK